MKEKLRLVLMAVIMAAACTQAAQKTKPNVILIVCDDLNDYVEPLGGHPQAKTPHMMRLAQSGVSFKQAHCTIAICNPSRASFLTGLYPHTSQCYGFEKWDGYEVLKNSRTMMDHFRKNGYYSLGTGKLMHNRGEKEWSEFGNFADYGPFAFDGKKNAAHPDIKAPFRDDFGSIDGSFGPLFKLDGRRSEKNDKPFTWRIGNWKSQRQFRYESETDRDQTPDEKNGQWAVDHLKKFAADPDAKPFFMGVGFIRPHTPLIVPQEYFDRFPLESIELPLIKEGDVKDTFKHTIISTAADRSGDRGTKIYHSLIASFDGNRKLALKKFVQAYLASVASVDDQVGRILDVVDNSPLKDNTIIVLTSDHGWGMGEKDYLYKNSLWQESTRVPLIIRTPGVSKAGAAVDVPVSLVDLFPTLIDLCGLSPNTMKNSKGRPLDGHSLKPLLTDPQAGKWDGPDAALTALYKWSDYYDPAKQSYALRFKDWRYIRYQNGKEELYHTARDPREWTNLALNPEYAQQLSTFRQKLLVRIPESKSRPKPTKSSDTPWKDKYFKKHPAADTNKDGVLTWPEYQAHKKTLKADKTKKSMAVSTNNLSIARQEKSLDGMWEIIFDHENAGRKAKWHLDKVFSAQNTRRNITVPSCWEEIEKDYEGVAYYRRTFMVPQNWQGKVVYINFDAVNFISDVWVNNHIAGHHEGGFTPFKLRVDKLLKPGEENTLILRVAGPILMSNKTIDGIGKMETPQWRGAITGGIWQPVNLVATAKIYVEDVFIEPKISDNTVTFHIQMDHAGVKTNPAQLEVVVRSMRNPKKIVARKKKKLDIKPGQSKQSWKLEIPNAKYWSPDDPHLYNVDITITSKGEVSDEWTAKFGMREFTIRDKQFYLNDKPIYLKATFFEGLYPTKLAYPDSKEMAMREIKLAKQAGFNMIRPWRKPPPKMWLDLCDQIGVLTVGSMVIECMDFPFTSDRLPRWVENEIRESILRDRNRTCVVQWELFNELKRPVLIDLLEPMSKLARKLDPTRMILDESGGWAQGANMYLPYESVPIKFNDIHFYPGPFVNEDVYQKLMLTGSKTHKEMRSMGFKGSLPGRNVIPGLMSFFSELGYGSLPDLVDNNQRFEKTGNPIVPPMLYHRRLADGHMLALKESGFDYIYPNLKQLCLDEQLIHGTANKLMIETVRTNPEVKGYCIHALTAGDWIIGAGLLDIWRNPKTYVYEGTKAANQPRIIPIHMHPRNVYAEKGAMIEITGVNELEMVKGTLKLEIVSDADQTVFEKELKISMTSGIKKLFQERIDTKALKGTYTLKAKVVAKNGQTIAVNEFDFDVFTAEQLAVPKRKIAVLDPSNTLKPFLTKSGIVFEEFSSTTDRSLPVFVSRTQAKTNQQRAIFTKLKKFVNSGGTAVYFNAGGTKMKWGKAAKASPLLPVKVLIKRGLGNWMGHPRFVKDHPIFDGLPVDCIMTQVYGNVFPQHALMDVKGQTLSATIGIDRFPDYDKNRRHYYGPGDVWWGSNMAVVPHGNGRCVLSQFSIVNYLGTDPVADKILFNLIEWTVKTAG